VSTDISGGENTEGGGMSEEISQFDRRHSLYRREDEEAPRPSGGPRPLSLDLSGPQAVEQARLAAKRLPIPGQGAA
jgi:hypothetical protein